MQAQEPRPRYARVAAEVGKPPAADQVDGGVGPAGKTFQQSPDAASQTRLTAPGAKRRQRAVKIQHQYQAPRSPQAPADQLPARK